MGKRTDYQRLWKSSKETVIPLQLKIVKLEEQLVEQRDLIKAIVDGKIDLTEFGKVEQEESPNDIPKVSLKKHEKLEIKK